MPRPIQIQAYDKNSEVLVTSRRLPHWAQAGTVTFVTWRTQDSIPAPVLLRWRSDRCSWLRAQGIDPDRKDWQNQLNDLPAKARAEFHREFSDRWHYELDAGHGQCVLRQRELAEIVANSLKHFDGERYLLTDFVVMPNHVHLLVVFENEPDLLSQCESWKHFTATRINRILGRKGRFWEQDGFDHLIRSEDFFLYYRHYIAENPTKAHLSPGSYIHFTKPLSLLQPR
jgi:putative transposase